MRSTDDWVRDPGQCLRDFRKEHDLTLKETSAIVGLCKISHLSDIEHGISEPSIKLLRELLWWRNKPTIFIKQTAQNRINNSVRWTDDCQENGRI